eukprot:15448770-Alexandrium_andersonii.AAC.1
MPPSRYPPLHPKTRKRAKQGHPNEVAELPAVRLAGPPERLTGPAARPAGPLRGPCKHHMESL